MKRVNKVSILLILSVLSMFLICPAYGDSQIAPYPYSVEFEEYGTIFYMTPENNWDPDVNTSQLPKSGLYKADTLENIYTMDEYFYETDLYFTSDGMNFAVMTWQVTNEDKGVRFYENGTEQKYYRVTELMKDPSKRSYTAGHYFWKEYQEREDMYDQKNGTISVVTLDGIYYQFDIKTGKILQKEDRGSILPDFIACGKIPLWQIAVPLLIILIIAGGLYWYWKKKEKN